MEDYPLLDVKRHLVIEARGVTALLDTGSPISLGRRAPLRLGGRLWAPTADDPIGLAQISAWLGRRIDWLV